MRIFIDIGHPAHVHYFKHFARIMIQRGNPVFLSARRRYPVDELLKAEKLSFITRGAGSDSKLGKLLYLFWADLYLLGLAKRFNPDLFMCFGAVYLTHVAKATGRPCVFIDDTDNARLNRKFYVPFATHILTPDVFTHNLGSKQIRFKGYIELAYLHPRYFAPDKTILDELGVSPAEKYTLMRFVNWKANHDYGHTGITAANKILAAEAFRAFGKVFITSEGPLPVELNKYRIKIHPARIHHAISFASLLYGESATMASEAAVLGVPSIFVDNEGRCYTSHQEMEYGLVNNYSENLNDQEHSILKGAEILGANGRGAYQAKRFKLLSERISFTDYLVWLIEKYPASIDIVRNDPEYQMKFVYNVSE